MKQYIFFLATAGLLAFSCNKDHDAAGNHPSSKKKLLVNSDYNKKPAQFTYDANGHLVKEEFIASNGKAYKYVLVHTPVKVVRETFEDNVHINTFIMNLANNRCTTTEQYDLDAQGDTTLKSYGTALYNNAGQFTGWDYEGGFYTKSFYNADGDMIKVECYSGGSGLWRIYEYEYMDVEDKSPAFNREFFTMGFGEYMPVHNKHLLKRYSITELIGTPHKWSEMNFNYELDKDGYVIKGTRKDVLDYPYDWTWTNTWTN